MPDDQETDSSPEQEEGAAPADELRAEDAEEAAQDAEEAVQDAEEAARDVEEAPSAEPADGEGADADAPEPEEDVDIVPPQAASVRLPLVGPVPVWLAGATLAVAVFAFALILALGLGFWRTTPPETVASSATGVQGPQQERQELMSVERLAQMDYFELMDTAERESNVGDYGTAAQLYRAAADREEGGVTRVLLARQKLSSVLACLGRHTETLQICDSLRSMSRPGDQLWKHVLITSIGVLGEQERWNEFFCQAHLLRANSARYADEALLNRWLAYMRATANVRLYLGLARTARTLHGAEPPPFGRGACTSRPLTESDIVVTTGKYGDSSLRCEYEMGELRLSSEGAPMDKVLAAIQDATGLTIVYDQTVHHAVDACLEAIAPEHALTMVLGAAGLRGEFQDNTVTVARLEPRPVSAAEGLKTALWSAQECLILYPESENVAEVYYALGHLYMANGDTQMALDQLEILTDQFPNSPWAAYAYYVAGRTWYDRQDWGRASRNLLRLVDGWPDHPLSPQGCLWAGQSLVELQNYDEAVSCFRRALAKEANERLGPQILYNIAFCLEQSGASPMDVEERYLELRARYPQTEYARRADYRVARMALDAGLYAKAIGRYEFFLSNWPIGTDESRNACRDLIIAYGCTGDDIRAVILGEIMSATFGYCVQYWQALPALLDACSECHLNEMALQLTDRSLEAAVEPARRESLLVYRAQVLIEMGQGDLAGAVLASLPEQMEDADLQARRLLCEARLCFSRDPARALALCRTVAGSDCSQQCRASALRLMGEHCERTKQFDRAALLYSGSSPVAQEETGL